MELQIESACPSRSSGKERDTETGLDYFGARYYASNMGRWMSPDWSASPTAVPYADFSDPQTLNLYGYVRNNPLPRADADGHEQLIYQNGTAMSPLDPRVYQKPMTKTEAQIEIGIVEVAAAVPTGGASLEALAAGEIGKAIIGTIATTGLGVSGTSRILGAAAGGNPETIAQGAEVATTVTNPVGMAVTVATGGNLKAGGVASDASAAGSLVRHPSEAVKNPADAGLTVKNVVQDLKDGAQAARNFVKPAPPPKPKPPSPPPCALNKGGC